LLVAWIALISTVRMTVQHLTTNGIRVRSMIILIWALLSFGFFPQVGLFTVSQYLADGG
jgi:hypothetical protein